MKLLPHFFKRIGIVIFFIALIVNSIDEGRRSFMEGHNDASDTPIEYDFHPVLPAKAMHISDFTILIGLLIYVLSKNKKEDEFMQKLRYESAFIVLVLSLFIILILYIINPNIKIDPSSLISMQMVFYLILRLLKRKIILWEDYEEQS